MIFFSLDIVGKDVGVVVDDVGVEEELAFAAVRGDDFVSCGAVEVGFVFEDEVLVGVVEGSELALDGFRGGGGSTVGGGGDGGKGVFEGVKARHEEFD